MQFLSNNQLNVLIDDDDNFGFVDIVVTTPDGVSFTETAIKRSFVPQFFRFEPNRRIYVAGVHLDGVFLGRGGPLRRGGRNSAGTAGQHGATFRHWLGTDDSTNADSAARHYSGTPGE